MEDFFVVPLKTRKYTSYHSLKKLECNIEIRIVISSFNIAENGITLMVLLFVCNIIFYDIDISSGIYMLKKIV